MSAVAKQYIVSALFRNILTCLYMVTQHPNSFRLNLQHLLNIWHDKSHWMFAHLNCSVGGSNSKKLDVVAPVKFI